MSTDTRQRDTEFKLPFDRLELQIEARLKERLSLFDASDLAKVLLGDSIFSNMMVFGGAWQRGFIPVRYEAIMAAIGLNGAAVERNQRAFDLGRWAVLYPEDAGRMITSTVESKPLSLQEKINYRAGQLEAYQNVALATSYRDFVARFEDQRLQEAVAKGYHKLLAYKDEYEVARLLLSTQKKAEAEFEGDFKMSYHMAPPLLSKLGHDGRPQKRQFGPGMKPWLKLLSKLKGLRGTPFDPFGRTHERKMERALIAQYEQDMEEVLASLSLDTLDIAVALAELPLKIRGFGPVKAENEAKAAKERETLLQQLRTGGAPVLEAAE